jgi:hypothetical protein
MRSIVVRYTGQRPAAISTRNRGAGAEGICPGASVRRSRSRPPAGPAGLAPAAARRGFWPAPPAPPPTHERPQSHGTRAAGGVKFLDGSSPHEQSRDFAALPDSTATLAVSRWRDEILCGFYAWLFCLCAVPATALLHTMVLLQTTRR